MNTVVTPEPKSPCEPTLWKFDDVRTALLEAGGLITAQEAERRVLVLENAGYRGQTKTTNSLYAGVQLVMPGEIAASHRHSQSALRFVLEGSGAFTSVNGERTTMHVGDFIITPSLAWHDHENKGSEPIFWLDGLDLPIVSLLDASFAEPLRKDQQLITRNEGDSVARYASNMLPFGAPKATSTSPIFNYPYDHSREALFQLRQNGDWDVCHGIKMRYVNPTNGDHAMATIGTFLQLLPKGFSTASYRSTDASVVSVVEGSGCTTIGETTINWNAKDTFVIPSWHKVRHVANEDSVLFSFSDRPVQEKLGLFREDRGNN